MIKCFKFLSLENKFLLCPQNEGKASRQCINCGNKQDKGQRKLNLDQKERTCVSQLRSPGKPTEFLKQVSLLHTIERAWASFGLVHFPVIPLHNKNKIFTAHPFTCFYFFRKLYCIVGVS